MEWIPVPPNSEKLVEVFPDGFQMRYVDIWNLGYPDEIQHWNLCTQLIRQHGRPKLYEVK